VSFTAMSPEVPVDHALAGRQLPFQLAGRFASDVPTRCETVTVPQQGVFRALSEAISCRRDAISRKHHARRRHVTTQ